jgi:hypothetical protein
MINETISFTFKDGTIASIVLPAFAVGFAVVLEEPRQVVIAARMKTEKDETAYDAFESARQEYSKSPSGPMVWIPCSGIKLGSISTGADRKYWFARLNKKDDNVLILDVDSDDPILGAYRHITDRAASTGKSHDDLSKLFDFLTKPRSPELTSVTPPK